MSAHAIIHVGVKALGLDEETKRALYSRVTGKDSLKDMSGAEHLRVIDELKAKGFVASARRTTANGKSVLKLSGRYAGKLQALWIAGYNLGLIRSRDDMALNNFVRRQTGLEHVRFCNYPGDAARAIEALKGWLARAGVDWNDGAHLAAHARLSGFRIARAQYEILVKAGESGDGFSLAVLKRAGRAPVHLTSESAWIPVMNGFGTRVRAVKQGASFETPPQEAAPQDEGGRSASTGPHPEEAEGRLEGPSAQVFFFTGVKRDSKP